MVKDVDYGSQGCPVVNLLQSTLGEVISITCGIRSHRPCFSLDSACSVDLQIGIVTDARDVCYWQKRNFASVPFILIIINKINPPEQPHPQVKYGVRSPKFLRAPVSSCTHWLRPQPTPVPPRLGSYTRALLVSKDRRHLFVAPRPHTSRQGRERV